MEHVVVCIDQGLFEIGHRIPNSEYIVPTHAVRRTGEGWQVWDMVSGQRLFVFHSVLDAIESVCRGDWSLHSTPTKH